MLNAYSARRAPNPQPLSNTWLLPQTGQPAATACMTGSILVVEDEPELANLITRQLTKAGYTARLAQDGTEALRLADQEVPDLMILDWRLPEVDGLYVLRQVRHTIQDDLAVLMISARDAENDRIHSLDQGADDFLAKPFSLHELLARVRALLRRAERIKRSLNGATRAAPFLLRHGELLLDLPGRMATLAGQKLRLTRSEFELLSYLVQHVGCSFSRANLQERVWQQCHVPGDRSVDNIVLRLRRKLGPYASDLETVWGVGYRFKLRD